MNCFIDVILPIPLERNFTYAITPAEFEFLEIGMRVAVPFGKSKVYTALVFDKHQNPPVIYEAKEIHQILDDTPIVTIKQLEFWKWIANYYMCTLGDVIRAALPSAFLLESETNILRNTLANIDEDSLRDDEFLVYDALQHQSSLSVQDLSKILDKKNTLPVIKRLLEKKAIKIEEEIYEKYKPKLIKYVKINAQYEKETALQEFLESLVRAPKQRQIVLGFFALNAASSKPIKVSDLQKSTKGTVAQIKSLEAKGFFEVYHLQTDRVSFDTATLKDKVLNTYQEKALDEIYENFKTKNVTLLHGVTSSGKTEIYVKLITDVIAQGKQVLFLVPEIALTTQLVQRLSGYFGNQIAVYHSRYSSNERVEVWNYVLQNSEKARVVLGARSAVLLPFKDLGLIIIDEEHEQSYKQFDPAPRYHARDTAIVLANSFKTKTLLGSATPSLESYFNAIKEKKYGFVALKRRFNDVLMPEIELVDLKDKYKRKCMKGHFSDRMLMEMSQALENDSQIILFQNRRGFAPILECNTCGHSPQCPNCDVSLTYHQYRNQLRCHYCSHQIAMLQKCLACGSPDMDTKGLGTQQIEAEVQVLFPEAKVARMDLDTTRGKYSYDRIIANFEQHEVDILIGTQMVTKGLDFRNVKLVGIMNADNMLNFPDFRAHERSFQLMQQVSGRAGRTKERGKVLIQSFNPFHKILQQVSSNDYSGMFFEQLEERYNYKYPPIFRIIKITLRHSDYNKIETGADWFTIALRNMFKANVLGPEFPPVARIRNQYHKNILVKIPQEQSLKKTKDAIIKIKNSFSSVKDFRPIKVVINVDNY
ncbi:MAG: primosomal protein N' [Flavobacteriaceae bacterium]|nr:primosomal protein N' [Flavobacteriaceae bacterium]